MASDTKNRRARQTRHRTAEVDGDRLDAFEAADLIDTETWKIGRSPARNAAPTIDHEKRDEARARLGLTPDARKSLRRAIRSSVAYLVTVIPELQRNGVGVSARALVVARTARGAAVSAAAEVLLTKARPKPDYRQLRAAIDDLIPDGQRSAAKLVRLCAGPARPRGRPRRALTQVEHPLDPKTRKRLETRSIARAFMFWLLRGAGLPLVQLNRLEVAERKARSLLLKRWEAAMQEAFALEDRDRASR